jgi:sulfur-oxidizing protein SoxY
VIRNAAVCAQLTRREALALGAGAAALAGGLATRSHAQTPEKALTEIAKFTGGAEAQRAGVTLDLPEIAENGNTVPIAIKVASAMTPDSYVERVIVVTTANPLPRALSVSFSPASGRAEVATRIRLASTQEVYAIAKMSDGSFFMDRKIVKVTIGGCGG